MGEDRAMKETRWYERASWIEAPWESGPEQCGRPCLFRRRFRVEGPVSKALVRWTSIGVGEVRLDGKLLSEAVLFPGWTDYRKRVRYEETDVTAELEAGEHCLEVLVGDGWACGFIANLGRQVYAKRPAVLAEIRWTGEAGEEAGIATGEDWEVAKTPILESDLLMGERYDARLEKEEKAFVPVVLREGYSPERLERNTGPLVRRKERFWGGEVRPAVGCRKLYDLGQNIAGRVKIRVRGQAGTTLVLRHGETLQADGALYRENLRSALATDYYTLSGDGEETWEPVFTFHGFRYVSVDWEGEAACEILELEGIALYSDMEESGWFSCSHDGLNQLYRNIVWGQKGNFLDIPTDCPQRDERLGWTGDAQVFARTAAFNMDVRGFFRKWLTDLRDAQREDGRVPPVAPDVVAFGLDIDGGPAWADALILIPWYLYEVYGDEDLLRENYAAGCRYMNYVARVKVKDGIRGHPDRLSEDYFCGGFGDWLALDGGEDTRGITPRDLLGTAFYARNAEVLGAVAEVLGETEAAVTWRRLHEGIVAAYRRRFVREDGTPVIRTQTACVLSLHFDLLEPPERPVMARELVRLIEENGYHIGTGFVGTPYILPVLETSGYVDIAYRLLEQEAFPSWLFPVRNGATTIWERWDGWHPEKGFQDVGMNSFNHYAYGAVGEWMVRSVAGLAPGEPGYRTILFQPRPGGSLRSAQARYLLPAGEVSISWQLEADRTLSVELVVPRGHAGVLAIPGKAKETLGEGRHSRRFVDFGDPPSA